MEKLISIQNELKVGKSQYNSFGKYSYRSCEDILEAIKPLLLKYKIILNLSDELISIDDDSEIKDDKGNYIKSNKRLYVKATASLYNEDGKLILQSTGLAREELTKKGMDSSQITGAASSYARKYALNGLLAIDDTKDSDTTNLDSEKEFKKNNKEKAVLTPLDMFKNLIKNLPNKEELLKEWEDTGNNDDYKRVLYKRVKEEGK